MVEFKGSTYYGEGSASYEYSFYPTTGSATQDCGGWSLDLIGGEYNPGKNHNKETMSWGYLGEGPGLLAINMLATALKPDWLSYPTYMQVHPDRARILKHYRAFTEEIVANLPDEWTMTSDEVLAWLKKKEGQ